MCNRGEEESAGRMKWAAKSVGSDLWKKGNGKSERDSLQDSSETSYVVWFGVDGTDKKTGGGAGAGRVEDDKIFLGSYKDIQD